MASKYGNANPLLTKLSIDRRNAAQGYVAEFVAPTLGTGGKTSGEYWVFDQGNNFQNPNNEKASGGVSREISFKASVATFKTKPYGSRAWYNQKELDTFAAGGGSAADLRRAKMNMVTDADLNAHEVRVNTLVTTAASYAAANKKTLVTTQQWSDLVNSDPFGDVMTAKTAILSGDAVQANSMVVPWNVHAKLIQHPDIQARMSDNAQAGLADITAAKIGNLFGLDYRVATAQYNSANEGQTFSPSYAWGDFVLIFHRAPSPGKEQISLAYNFAYKNFQMRSYEDTPSQRTYVDNDHDVDTKMVAASVGYLISDVLA